MSLFQSLKEYFSKSEQLAVIPIHRRDVTSEAIPSGGKTENFDTEDALTINHARMEHLAFLNLPIQNKRVLDIGCGVGHLGQFFVRNGCDVLCLDARAENIQSLRERYPAVKAQVFNIEQDSIETLGKFDVVFAYGLLYHLENPFAALRSMASVCKELLLLETMICDHALPILKMEEETRAYSQAMNGVGSRPSPSYVVLALSRVGFSNIYGAKIPPDHPDFRFEWKNNLDSNRDGHPLRSVFIASRTPLKNPNLISLLED